jgi:hypothetical protein
MPGGIAHFLVMPNLQDFYRRYPDIYLTIGSMIARLISFRRAWIVSFAQES